jgi:hypothetical protein
MALAIFALSGCKNNREMSQAKEMPASAALASGVADQSARAAPVAPPGIVGRLESSDAANTDKPAQSTRVDLPASMLIRTGSASIQVDDLDPAIAKIRQLATQLGGYVANSSIAGGRDQVRTATLEIKIASDRYDQAIGGLGSIGKVESVNTSVEDVGEEYVDISARVANAKRLEERLISLLATRAGKLQDVLAVERELARVREEIERYEGRMRYLRTRAAMSTLSVTVHEPYPILGRAPGSNPIVAAFQQAWRNFVGFVAWFIASLGALVPAAVLGLIIRMVYRRVRKS